MKKPLLLHDKTDIIDYLRSRWRTPEFQESHDSGGFVFRLAERFARLPRFFYEMSDEYLERAHFSVWWSGVALRDYEQGSCSDLYLLHEIAHGADMVHIANQHSEGFRRKMQDNELLASVTTEVMAYFAMPSLRDYSFKDGIFADRFLPDPVMQARWRDDPERLLWELHYRRRNAMFWPDRADPIEMWLHTFTVSNEKWFNIWARRYDVVETAMENLTRASALGQRRDALLRHMDWLDGMTTNNIPFLTEAQKFADVYWEGRQKPESRAA